MNWDQIEGKWKELKGKARSTWGKLTHQDLETIRGRRTELIGKLQQLYGFAKAEAEKQVELFKRKLTQGKVRRALKRAGKRVSPKAAKAMKIAKKKTPSRRKAPKMA